MNSWEAAALGASTRGAVKFAQLAPDHRWPDRNCALYLFALISPVSLRRILLFRSPVEKPTYRKRDGGAALSGVPKSVPSASSHPGRNRPMKNLCLAPAVLGLFLAAPALAQQPVSAFSGQPAPAVSLTGAENATAPAAPNQDTWSYPQQIRQESAAAAVRRNAEFRSLQRRHRIASARWYGFSNSRPTTTPTPWWGTYRDSWVSGTSRRSYAWPGTRWPNYFVSTSGR